LAVFLRVVGEPTIARAIAWEARRDGVVEDELFSRGAQQVGGMVGAVAYGVCLGVVAALALGAVRRRSARADEWRQAMVLGVAGFVTLALVPALKYPANPPGVGDPATIGRRSVLFLAVVAWSVLASWCSWRLWARLRSWPEHQRVAVTAGFHTVVVGAAFVALPGSPDAVAAPATLVWQFRVASLAGAGVFWAVLGWVLGCLARRQAAAATDASAR
jgi:predicted cobalt transporter CbtA